MSETLLMYFIMDSFLIVYCRGVVFDGVETHYLELPTGSETPGPAGDKVRRNGNVNALHEPNHDWEVMHYKHSDFKRNLSCG
jgi:hypothetical protein